jgi:hypothetical protein
LYQLADGTVTDTQIEYMIDQAIDRLKVLNVGLLWRLRTLFISRWIRRVWWLLGLVYRLLLYV